MATHFKPLEGSKHKIVIDYAVSKKMALELFTLSVSYFIKYDAKDQVWSDNAHKKIDEIGQNLQQVIRESITKEPSTKKVEYWIEVMDQLNKMGEYSLSQSIALILSEQKDSKIEGVKESYAAISEESQLVLDNIDIRGKVEAHFYLDSVNFVTIPSYLFYTKSAETIKNLGTAIKDQKDPVRKTGLETNLADRKETVQQIADASHEHLITTLDSLKNELSPLAKIYKHDNDRLIKELEKYQKKYEGSTKDTEIKKYKACTQLLSIIKDDNTSESTKIRLLNGFVELTPSFLEHQGLTWTKPGEFTLITIAKELTSILPSITLHNELAQMNIESFATFKKSFNKVVSDDSEAKKELLALFDNNPDYHEDFFYALLRVVDDVDKESSLTSEFINLPLEETGDFLVALINNLELSDEQVLSVIQELKENEAIQLPRGSLDM